MSDGDFLCKDFNYYYYIIIIIIINIKFHKALTRPLYEFILHNNRKLVSALFQFIHTKVNYC